MYTQIDTCRLPGLAMLLTLEACEGMSDQANADELVAFISGLLLSSDVDRRNWFAQFMRGNQKVFVCR